MKNSKFQQYIANKFERRKKINPRYSLRAFAQHLNIQASLLSRILRGKIPLTEKALKRLMDIGELEKNSNGELVPTHKTTILMEQGLTNAAFKQRQKQVFKRPLRPWIIFRLIKT